MPMKKQPIIYILLAFLIIVNGFFLFHFLKKPKPPKKPELFIVEELGFNEVQMKEFELMSDLHFDKMQGVNRQIKRLKDDLFSKVSEAEVPPTYLDSITSLIGEQEKQKDILVFTHMQKVKDLCDERQKKKFDKILMKALRQHRPGGRPRGPGPK